MQPRRPLQESPVRPKMIDVGSNILAGDEQSSERADQCSTKEPTGAIPLATEMQDKGWRPFW
ncbi:MAG TPA: hypothetical protein PLA74_11890 [Syntrophales bacterium]|nr:hypothetical protein [Syntrophales bacterium]